MMVVPTGKKFPGGTPLRLIETAPQLSLVEAVPRVASLTTTPHPVAPRRKFVEQFAQTVQIRLRRARPFRRNETLGSDEGVRTAGAGDQANVRQFGLPPTKITLLGLTVPVNESVTVQMSKRAGQPERQLRRIGCRQTRTAREFRAQRARAVRIGIVECWRRFSLNLHLALNPEFFDALA
jgi:hypothetical protein